MKTLRRLALAALAAGLTSCHDDPEVITVVVTSLANGLGVSTGGGSATLTSGAPPGTGGDGGAVRILAFGAITAGTNPVPPVAPSTPTAPTTGETATSVNIDALTGNLLIGNVVTAGNTIFSALNGDIVVSGTLQAGDNGVTQDNITLSAPNGTVFVTGTVRTASVDGTLNGDTAGMIAINAARIVISGVLDASGEADSTGLGATGGNTVTLASSAGQLVLLSTSSVLTSGGSSTATAGSGGGVALAANGGGLHVFGAITTSGGPAVGVATPTGGPAGNLTLTSDVEVNVWATLTLRGGAGTGAAAGANGGAGGDILVDGDAGVRCFGTFDLRGGAASANAGPLVAGGGGNLDIGQTTPVLFADLGLGTYSTAGGDGGASGGVGGQIRLESDDGAISVACDFVTSGGSGLGSGPATGGTGGDVTLQCDDDFTFVGSANTSPHLVTLLVEGSILSSGGGASGAAAAGSAGDVTISGGGDLTVAGPITAVGGMPVSGLGGSGGTVSILANSANTAAIGDAILSGAIRTEGASSSGQGGDGGDLIVTMVDFGGIVSSSTITSSAGDGGTLTAGAAGAVTFTTLGGDVTISGSITSTGGDSALSPGGPTAGGAFTATAGANGGRILFSAALNVGGGSSTASSLVTVTGGTAGDVVFSCGHSSGFILLSAGTSIAANGGTSTNAPFGGTGGEIFLTTIDQSVSISGSIVARGGTALGGGVGGPGGAVQVNTDGGASDGVGGDITLTSGSSIDVSGGTGPTAGPARFSFGAGVTPGVIATLAVQFDAVGGLGASADSLTGGIVINNGTIIASGVSGGDLFFDGRGASGLAASDPVAGSVTPTPGAGTEFVAD